MKKYLFITLRLIRCIGCRINMLLLSYPYAKKVVTSKWVQLVQRVRITEIIWRIPDYKIILSIKLMNTILLFSFLLFSCTSQYSPEIEHVLDMAGSNRSELEKVLKYYRKNPADSLKLRAAEFLIINMPGKYSKYYDAPWNDVATAMLRWTSSPDKNLISGTYQLGEQIIKEDLKYITADYLISNIDIAFKVWQERPWGKHVSFDIFCEEILPYRIGTEPLENWRKKVLASFAGLDMELNKPNMTAIEACRIVNEALPNFRLDKDFPDMTYSQAMASTRGSCDKMVAFAAFTMRGLGIPVTIDFTPVYTGRSVGHSWNAVCDSTGKHISFLGTETPPDSTHQALEVIQHKIYRRTYAIQKENIQIPLKNIPPLLRNSTCIDVSSEYKGFLHIRVPLTVPPPDNTGYVYLAVIGDQTKRNIIARGHVEGTYAFFSAMGQNTGYFPVYYKDNNPIKAGEPFLLDSLGNMISVVNGPFKGPHILSVQKPCVIPMCDFDIGGEGVAFHEVNEINRGSVRYRLSGGDPFSVPVDIEYPENNVGFIDIGEWLQYTIEVKDAGTYLCQLNASGGMNGKFHLKVDGKNRTGSVDLPSNGEWFKWEWFPKIPLQLIFTAGTHQIQFYCEQKEFNVKEMKFTFLKK